MKMVGQRRRQRRLARLSSSSASSASTSSCIGLARCAVLPLLLLPLLQQAAAFSLPAPVGRLLRLGRGAPVVVAQQRVTTTALAAAVGEDGGGGGGYPISPNYGDEEDDVDVYLKSLKRAEASGPPAPQGGGGGGPPKLSPEEVKRRNEEAKARMEAYSRGELPPALQAWKSGAAPAAPAAGTDAEGGGQQQQQGGFDPNFWQKFYIEHEAKLAAEKAAKEAEAAGGAEAALPAPAPTTMAPIQPPAPEPVQSPYNTGAGGGAYEQQLQQQQRQQQRQQAAVDPYAAAPGRAEESPYASAGAAGDASGGSRFKKMLDMGAKASQGNSAKEKLKAFLLSRYAPDDMSPQAVAYRRLISGAESGFVGAEVKDEYMEGLKMGAKQKAAELYKRVGVPLPPEASQLGPAGGGGGGYGPPRGGDDGSYGGVAVQPQSASPVGRRMNPGLPSAQAELGLTTGDHYINALTRAKQQRLAGGGAAAPAPQPPQQPPPSQQQRPAIDPYTGRPQGQPFGVPPPAAYQQPPPPPPVQQQQQQWASMPPPPPPPAPPAYQPPRAPDAALLASMQQLEGQLQAHRAGGPGGRLQGVELDRLEHLLRQVGALLHEESSTVSPQQPPQYYQPPPPQPAAPTPAPPAAAPAPAAPANYLLPHAARSRLLAAADALGGLAGLTQEDAGPAGAMLLTAQATGAAGALEEAFKVLEEVLAGPQTQVGRAVAAAALASAPAPAPAPAPVAAPVPAPAARPTTGSAPPPPPKVATVELDKKDRARLQGLMALVLKHSGAFGPNSGPLMGEEKTLLRNALAEMGALLRKETEGAYGESVESYLEAHPETLEQYRQLQAKLTAEGSPFAAPSGPPPASKPVRSYKEQLELARKARAGAGQ